MPLYAVTRCLYIGVTALLMFVGACDEGCIDAAGLWRKGATSGAVSVCGDLIVTGRSQAELQVLTSVEEIEGGLYFYDNPLVAEIPALAKLARVGGSLSISGNEALLAVRGFPALVQLDGALYLGENPLLREFRLGEGVATVESVFIALNPGLTEVSWPFTAVNESVTIVGNAALIRIEAPALTAISGHLHIDGNPALERVEFPALGALKGTLRIEDNDALVDMPGFAALTEAAEVRIAGNDSLREVRFVAPLRVSRLLYIGANEALSNIWFGEAATFAQEGSVHIRDNPALETIGGFGAVETLAFVRVEGNDHLREISAFAALDEIAGPLHITGNPALVGPVDWFASLRAVEDVAIYQNAGLAPGLVDALLDHVTVTGTARVGDNQGENTALDPCPWPDDGVCDGPSSDHTTGLCAEDPEDCDA